MINLLGLSIGLATCLIATLYIKHELSADQFHKDVQSIYHITAKLKDWNINGVPYPFAEAIEKEIPGIKESLRTIHEETIVKIDDEFHKHEVVYADPSIFNFFTLPLQYGNSRKALYGLKNVVLGEASAAKYFPSQNPIGKIIQIKIDNEYRDFEISGVSASTPAYSSIHFDFLIPLENWTNHDPDIKTKWSSFLMTTFVKIPADQFESVQEAMADFTLKYSAHKDANGKSEMTFVFNPFAKHHLSEGFEASGLYGGRSSKGLMVFGGIAIIILLLACFNFMNLTNAQSSRRAVEVGIRKVVGAGRAQLIRQFLFEALAMSASAALFALGLAELSLLVFRDIVDVDITVFQRGNLDIYLSLLVITIVAGLLAGAYPAVVLSNVSALRTFKRYFKIDGSNNITRFVLTLQFGLSIILIVCAMVMWEQQSYMMNKDLGYNKSQVLIVPFAPSDTSAIGFMKNEIKTFGESVSIAKSSGAFTRGNNISIQKLPDESRVFIYIMSIDEDFLSTMELPLLTGRDFTPGDAAGHSRIIVNETLIRDFSLQDSIGMKLGRRIGWAENPTIVGVVKDFHSSALKQKIAPFMFLYERPLNNSYLLVRLSPGKISKGIEKIRAIWEKTNTNSPFEYHFLDDDVQNQYKSEARWSSIIGIGTGIAIFLSVLGLLGLSMFTAEQRKKEIGIRKVLGASLRQIVGLLSRGYLWIIAIAFIISIPVSYYLMSQYWLNNFEYKIEITTTIYLTALVLVLFITLLAIGSQTLRAASQNPADTLKEE